MVESDRERQIKSRYGVRYARWVDTNERFGVATIDGEPVAVEPSEDALDAYAEDRGLAVVTQEFLRDLLRHDRASR